MPDNMPFVSWLLCSNRAGPMTVAALNSCFEQSYQNFEIIFVANGKDRATIAKEVIAARGLDKRLRVFQVETDHLPFSLSFGVEKARGEWIARMDCDDIALPNRLEQQVERICSSSPVDLLGMQFDWIDENGKISKARRNPITNAKIRAGMIWHNPICHPSIIIRRQLLLQHGGYLGGIHAEDYDLWCTLSLEHDIVFENLSEVGILYRKSQENHLARKSYSAFATVASSQIRCFVLSGNLKWILAFVVTLGKIFKKYIYK